eukprot:TRINITY_DN32597_c0_g1_i1.p1 TRINITY_DN32597_c0_g1~~TRINITY_DN32597_c0_g1_i1.p1  ORF type:complete len:124 (-),score=27.91 TRINITY_DN32597_c0_g1_i1:115-486(-)
MPAASRRDAVASGLLVTTGAAVARPEAAQADDFEDFMRAEQAKKIAARQQGCYITIDGTNYDVGSFMATHKGGSTPLMGMCCKDATSAFMSSHQGLASGRAAETLKGLPVVSAEAFAAKCASR